MVSMHFCVRMSVHALELAERVKALLTLSKAFSAILQMPLLIQQILEYVSKESVIDQKAHIRK
jgi:hypothetical protein